MALKQRVSFNYTEVLSNSALALMYLILAYAHLQAYLLRPRMSLLLICVFEAILVGLVLFRRPQQAVMTDRRTVIIAAAASFTPLLLRPDPAAADLLVGQVLQSIGVLLQLASALSLWRSFGLLPANRGIQTGGMYRLVRHPLYFSYLVTQAGYLLNNPTLLNALILAIALAFQIMRIRLEEQLLMGSPAYATYARGVRWRLVPLLW